MIKERKDAVSTKKKKKRKKKKEKMLKGVEKKLMFDKRKKTQKPLIKKNKGRGT